MILDYSTYRDKVMGCWAGKNIGGVLGAPFEGYRQINEIEFYTQDLSKGLPPNDDLDLQIVWLAAVERYGRNVNASILGEYWLSYIVPNWAEYGTGKANLRAGLVPPLSGVIDNIYKDSCGCFIRSEIWACLAPGHPDIAARYAYEDAIVDHSGEGMYGEIFFAALQSAAFVESDRMRLIEIGLSYLPESSVISKAIRKAIECYEQKIDFYEARKEIHNTAPGTFGLQLVKLSEVKEEGNEGMDIGAPGFDAPENVAFTIAAWLYGEEDFGKSLCLAVSCGEDTDCTCATLGAILGIIHGAKNLPEKWTKPLNDQIATICIDKSSAGIWVPRTVTELAERVIRTMPLFLGQNVCDILAKGGMTVLCQDNNALYNKRKSDYLQGMNGLLKTSELPMIDLCSLSSYVVRNEFTAFSVMVDYGDSVYFRAYETRKIKVTVVNSHTMCQQQWAKIKVYMPSGVEVMGGSSVKLPLNNVCGAKAETTIEFNADLFDGSDLEFMIDVSLEGRHSYGAIKIKLMRKW